MSYLITNQKAYDAICEIAAEMGHASRRAIAFRMGVVISPRLIEAIEFCVKNNYVRKFEVVYRNGVTGWGYAPIYETEEG